MPPIIPLVLILVLAGCLPGRKPPEPTAPVGTAEYAEQQRTICEARGGNFAPAPGSGLSVCFETPKDANAPCNSASDCDGACLARSRTCSPVKPLLGCNEVLLDGGQLAEICVD